eukprot:gene2890-3592_t
MTGTSPAIVSTPKHFSVPSSSPTTMSSSPKPTPILKKQVSAPPTSSSPSTNSTLSDSIDNTPTATTTNNIIRPSANSVAKQLRKMSVNNSTTTTTTSSTTTTSPPLKSSTSSTTNSHQSEVIGEGQSFSSPSPILRSKSTTPITSSPLSTSPQMMPKKNNFSISSSASSTPPLSSSPSPSSTPPPLSTSAGEIPVKRPPLPTRSFTSNSLTSSTNSLLSSSPSPSPSPSSSRPNTPSSTLLSSSPSPSLTNFSTAPPTQTSTPPLKPTPKKPALPPRNELQATSGTITIPKLKPVGGPVKKDTTTMSNGKNQNGEVKRFLKKVIKDDKADSSSSDEEDSNSSSSNNNSTKTNNTNGNGNSTTNNSNANGTKDKKSHDLMQRTYLAQEILSTEKKYINNLNRIITIFILPLRDKANGKDKILSLDEINTIFSNIEIIFGVHKTFLSDFESRIEKWTDTQKIGDIFLKMAPYLRSYTQYSNSYNNSMLTIRSLQKSNPAFDSFLSKCLLKPASKGLNLQSYLIMPIQRIPRYRLLLEQIIKFSLESHVDYPDLKSALELISSVAGELDERLLQYQIAHKVLDIQNSLNGLDEDIVKPTRVFLKEGDLKKISDRVVNTRHFFLFNDLLIYSKKEGKNNYRFKYSFPLLTCWLKDLPDTQRFTNLFQIISPNKTYFLSAPSPEEKSSWMKLLNEVINKMVDANPECQPQRASIYEKRGSMSPNEILNAIEKNIPSDENESELRSKPLWLKDQMTKACMLCTSSFTMTRRRHHCRKCGKIFCNDCCPVQDFTQFIQGKKVRVCKTCYEELSVQLEVMANMEDQRNQVDNE